ncbi:YncE family protein [Alsobacter sp. R-9]
MLSRLLSSTMILATLLAAPAVAGSVFVADETGQTITTLDPDTGKTQQISLAFAPHNVDAGPGGLVLAVGVPDHAGGHAGMPAGRLVVAGAKDGVLAVTADYEVGGHPAHVVPDREGKFAYITDAAADAVAVVDLGARRVTTRIAVGRYPHGLRLSPDGATLAIANMKSGTVSLVDVASRKQVTTVSVGAAPVQVAFAPDGGRLYVSLNGENKVVAIDLASKKLAWKAAVGRGPVQLAVAGPRVIVANQGNAKSPDNTVSVLDAATGAAVETVLVGKGAHGVALAPGATRAYVTDTYENTVSVVDLATLKETARYPVGKGPNGIVSP